MKWLVLSSLCGMMNADAWAGCETDVECKGDRICIEGSCEDPSVPVENPTFADPDASRAAMPVIRSARRHAIAGTVLGSLSVVSGIGAAITAEDGFEAPLLMGGFSLLSAAVAVPVAAAHGRSLRKITSDAGRRPLGNGMRVASWVLYGVAMAEGAGLIVLGVTEEIPPALIGATVITGATSASLMIADTFVSAKRAEQSQNIASRDRAPLQVMPSVAWQPGGGSIALVGSF